MKETKEPTLYKLQPMAPLRSAGLGKKSGGRTGTKRFKPFFAKIDFVCAKGHLTPGSARYLSRICRVCGGLAVPKRGSTRR